MQTFKDLQKRILETSALGHANDFSVKNLFEDFDKSELNCLFTPERHPVFWNFDACVTKANQTGLKISKDVHSCMQSLHRKKNLAYALIAPAFIGQFSDQVTPGMLRSAFKQMGFDGMVEVAVFADILTLKEALEFDQNIISEKDYQLTSCCCPMWIAMIRKIYSELMPHVPATVSPMIAAGRTVKILHPDALTVFIGPCIAKKAEAREPDLQGAIDHVLTFQETQELFDLLKVDLTLFNANEKENSSKAGRIYARVGGVSEAVSNTVERLNPNREIAIKTRQADGVINCKAMINELMSGQITANFFEGMGCIGGCVGGPKSILDKAIAKDHINTYGEKALYPTPIDNPYVIELLHRLGFDTPESLIEDNKFFTRKF
ncbi:[Fe-Fe] hydrogenase large subunit C-terminal domain-containing protein [Anaerosinus massiliensis]|uniref:[Fe-Fe] hydrogenase large subunit C-terminal domain-containing protein n=1 Tax=Massilibacillus massiliensis TaxID=1806837 RepID=UPI000AC5E6F1|nr:[Fe-Fe] hydrogenase large subunit C-terminal domain-containing protein [Massilibacillus massiliensis]